MLAAHHQAYLLHRQQLTSSRFRPVWFIMNFLEQIGILMRYAAGMTALELFGWMIFAGLLLLGTYMAAQSLRWR
jgi:hypothetical protein